MFKGNLYTRAKNPRRYYLSKKWQEKIKLGIEGGKRIVVIEGKLLMWRVMRAEPFTVDEM